MVPQTFATAMILFAPLLGWLAACTVCDLRTRQVPAWLTVLPLVGAAVWRFTQGGWSVVILVVGLVLISDLPWKRVRIPLASGLAALTLIQLGDIQQVIAGLAAFSIWVMWELGALGGADAKMIITLVLLYGDGFLLVPILLVGGIQGLVAMITHRKTIPYTIAITVGTVIWFMMISLN